MSNSEYKNKYSVIGLMSGTSLDGIDLAHCEFEFIKDAIKYNIKAAETIAYSEYFIEKLQELQKCDTITFFEIDRMLGFHYGEIINSFLKRNNIIEYDAVCSHGHTIFHQPDKKFTIQVGHGAAIAAKIKKTVVCDFRSLDVALGGQGAPLVPIGDKLLFSDYNFCLNLGGISNITLYHNDIATPIAFDICPVNMILNNLAEFFNQKYDKDGEIARSGTIEQALLNELNALDYYHQKPPKSLGKEWFLANFLPIIEKSTISVKDKMATVCEHIAIQISKCVKENLNNVSSNNLLVTGGGAHNVFLIERIQNNLEKRAKIIVPEKKIVDFKEALIFGLLGVLRLRKEQNTLKSVTGAEVNSIGGCVYFYK